MLLQAKRTKTRMPAKERNARNAPAKERSTPGKRSKAINNHNKAVKGSAQQGNVP
jgi:hypothetical protein